MYILLTNYWNVNDFLCFFAVIFSGFFPFFHVAVMRICNSPNMGIFGMLTPYICVFVIFVNSDSAKKEFLKKFYTIGIYWAYL